MRRPQTQVRPDQDHDQQATYRGSASRCLASATTAHNRISGAVPQRRKSLSPGVPIRRYRARPGDGQDGVSATGRDVACLRWPSYVAGIVHRWDPRRPGLPEPGCPWRCPMAATIPSTSLVPVIQDVLVSRVFSEVLRRTTTPRRCHADPPPRPLPPVDPQEKRQNRHRDPHRLPALVRQPQTAPRGFVREK
jgi:hypothetical protein